MNFKGTLKNINLRKALTVLFFACSFLFLNLSCGIDAYYYLEMPLPLYRPNIEIDDDIHNYFTFMTNETGANAIDGEFSFTGTDIYYKIYKSSSVMLTFESKIDNAIEKANGSAANQVSGEDASALIQKTYTKLNLTGRRPEPLIRSKKVNQNVYIRLSSNGQGAYQSCICVDSSAHDSFDNSSALKMPGGIEVARPVRNVEGENSVRTFNFGGGDRDIDLVPKSTDSDVNYDGVGDEGVWYVDMYAVSTGYNSATFSNDTISQPLFLGSVRIVEGSYSSK